MYDCLYVIVVSLCHSICAEPPLANSVLDWSLGNRESVSFPFQSGSYESLPPLTLLRSGWAPGKSKWTWRTSTCHLEASHWSAWRCLFAPNWSPTVPTIGFLQALWGCGFRSATPVLPADTPGVCFLWPNTWPASLPKNRQQRAPRANGGCMKTGLTNLDGFAPTRILADLDSHVQLLVDVGCWF